MIAQIAKTHFISVVYCLCGEAIRPNRLKEVIKMGSFVAGFFWTLGRLTATLIFDILSFFAGHLFLALVIALAYGVAKIAKKFSKKEAN